MWPAVDKYPVVDWLSARNLAVPQLSAEESIIASTLWVAKLVYFPSRSDSKMILIPRDTGQSQLSVCSSTAAESSVSQAHIQ